MDKLPQIQIARAIAALLVVLLHSYMGLRFFNDAAKVNIPFVYSWGHLGVNLFFSISGFIIALVLGRSDTTVQSFFVRRFFRIYPVYWVFVFFALASNIFFLFPLGGNDLSFTSILKSFLIFPVQGEPLYAVGWSLEHEIIFYVIAGLLIPLGSIWWVFFLTAALGIAGFVLHPVWDFHVLSSANLDFAVGTLVYLTRSKSKRLGFLIPSALSVASYVLATNYKIPFATLPAEGFFLIAVLNLPTQFVLERLSPLIRIGDISYSLYLGHWLVIWIASFVASSLALPDWFVEPYRFLIVLTSIRLASIFHKYIEKPTADMGHLLGSMQISSMFNHLRSAIKIIGHSINSKLVLVIPLLVGISMLTAMSYRKLKEYASAEGVLSGLASTSAQLANKTLSNGAKGVWDLEKLRNLGVQLPDSLINDGKLSTRWGSINVVQDDQIIYFDLNGVPRATCEEILVKASEIPHVIRGAATGNAADERSLPIRAADAHRDCRRSTYVRLILKPTPVQI